MAKIYVKKQSNYPIKASEIKKYLTSFINKRGIVSDYELSIAIVGEKKMLDLSRKYLKDNKVHNVLSFSEDEIRKRKKERFVYPTDKLFLGEIIVCYPKVFEEARQEGKRINEKVNELLEHGVLHLMGIHHE